MFFVLILVSFASTIAVEQLDLFRKFIDEFESQLRKFDDDSCKNVTLDSTGFLSNTEQEILIEGKIILDI